MSGECEKCGNHTLECECEQSPERIWIEQDDCPYFYYESELADVGSPVTEYVRADLFDAMKTGRDALLNLLAIIHRDGGHHTDKVGITASIDDAHRVWAELQSERDQLLAKLTEAKRICDSITQADIDAARSLIERLKGGRDDKAP